MSHQILDIVKLKLLLIMKINKPLMRSLKFLKNQKTEFSYIQELVQSLAISHPEVAFILKNNGSDVIVTTQNADLLTRITQIYPANIIEELKEVRKTDVLTGISITGYVSVPSYTRSSKKSIYTFVNSRTVKCPILLKAIDIAYKNMLPNGRYPFVVINIDINPNEIDVNAHPTKREIRYKTPNQIFNFVQSAVSYALSNVKVDVELEPEKESKVVPFSKQAPEFGSYEEESTPAPVFPIRVERKIEDKPIVEEVVQQKKMEIEFETPSKLKQVNVIGQFKNTYILVENEDSLELIDQHIAQERYIYEKLKNQKEVASQLLIISDVLDIEPNDIEILDEAKEQLAKFGYQIEKISNNQIIFKKIPQVLSQIKPKDILAELLENLKHSQENDLDTTEERILITTSCKASVKAGERLTLWQMEEIVKNLRTTKNPYTCPHGRPISHFISHKEVASFFDRNV